MKKTMLITLSMLITIMSFGQKSTKTKVTVNCEIYPLLPLKTAYKTFKPEVKCDVKDMNPSPVYLSMPGVRDIKQDAANPELIIRMTYYTPVLHKAFFEGKFDVTTQLTHDKYSIPYKIEVVEKGSNNIIYTRLKRYYGYMNSGGLSTAIKDKNMEVMGNESDFLQGTFFISDKEEKFSVYSGKGKEDYTDLDNVATKFSQAVEKYNSKNFSDADVLFTECINDWKKILEQKDFNNKKARINKDIAVGIYFDIAQSYLLMKKFDEAKKTLEGLSNETEIEPRDQYDYNELKKLIEDFQLRNEVKMGVKSLKFKDVENSAHLSIGSDYMDPGLKAGLNKEDLSQYLGGTWRLVHMSYQIPGSTTTDRWKKNLLDERENCKRIVLDHYYPDGSLLEQTGSWDEECPQKFDNYYWKIRLNTKDGKNYLLIDTNPEIDPDVASIFLINSLNQDQFSCTGEVYIEGDSTSEVYMVFERVE
ncbi:MAG: hypothetical protein JXB49_16740 [Bacteroidales bacterium]|nr:hypothetical protein [Bacteroidales bacterium]